MRDIKFTQVSRSEIQEMIDESIRKLQAKLNLEDVNKKSMTLKIKSNRNNHMREANQNFWESEKEHDNEKPS